MKLNHIFKSKLLPPLVARSTMTVFKYQLISPINYLHKVQHTIHLYYTMAFVPLYPLFFYLLSSILLLQNFMSMLKLKRMCLWVPRSLHKTILFTLSGPHHLVNSLSVSRKSEKMASYQQFGSTKYLKKLQCGQPMGNLLKMASSSSQGQLSGQKPLFPQQRLEFESPTLNIGKKKKKLLQKQY